MNLDKEQSRKDHENIEQHELHLNVAKQTGDKAGEGKAYGNIGNCYQSLGQYDKAKQNHELHLNIAKQIGDKAGEGKAYGNIGNCYQSLGQYEKAKQNHELHLNIAKQIGDKAGEGMAYGNLGDCYHFLGQNHEARVQHELLLDIAKDIGDKAGEEKAYDYLRNYFQNLAKQFEQAKEHLGLHLNKKQIGDKAGDRSAYEHIGNRYFYRGEYNKAKEHYELKLNIDKQLGDEASEGKDHASIGNCYLSLGQYDKAKEHYELKLNIDKLIGNKSGERIAYGSLGVCYFSLGQYDKAKECQELNLNIAKQFGDKVGEGGAYCNLGNCYQSLGEYDKAKRCHDLSLNIAKQFGDNAGKGRAYANLGICYGSLGQYNKAKEHHELNLNIAKRLGDKASEGKAYANLGNCYRSLGQYDKAKEHHELHLNIAIQIGNKADEGIAYDNLGNCYQSLQQYDKAKEHHELQLNIAKQIGDKAGEGSAYGNLGVCYYSLEQYDKAVEQHEIDLNIAKQIRDKAAEGRAYGNLGNCYHSLGQYDKAERGLRNSVGCSQELFKNAPNEDSFKVSFFETFSTAVSSLIKVLLIEDKTDEALVFAEAGRSRALAELMVKRYHLRRAEQNVLDLPQIREMVKAIDSTVLYFLSRTSEICTWVIKPNGDIKFNNHCMQISQESMESCLKKTFCSREDRDLKALICNAREMLTSRCAVKCEDRSLSFMYQDEMTEPVNNEPKSASPLIATPEGTTALEPREPREPRDRSSLSSTQKKETSTTTLSEQCRGTEDPKESESDSDPYLPLKLLYQILLAPVRRLVEGSQVVIVADGPLPTVPFAALLNENGRYVAESLQVRLIPSLATAKMISEYPEEPQGPTSPLIVGDPDVTYFEDDFIVCEPKRLPNAGKEARMIGQLLNVQPLTGNKATRQAVLDKLESANLIHVAAHGDEERGEILLAPRPGVDRKNVKKEDVMLTISHLEQKRLRAKLVVLSCCHSGRGEVKAEGVIGIARAFLGAGARAVLVAIWAVNDKTTLYFMKEFYEHLARGEKASEALSKAMKAMRENEEFSHPYYWAPFVLIGDDVTPLNMS